MVLSKAEEMKRVKARNMKKKQGLQSRLNEAEGKRKGMKKKKQSVGARLDEAEPRKRASKTAGRRNNYGRK
tara:strand:+ start:574 stop:786 length:213 start_codon:yes stop_codon:yes gene_type:complete